MNWTRFQRQGLGRLVTASGWLQNWVLSRSFRKATIEIAKTENQWDVICHWRYACWLTNHNRSTLCTKMQSQLPTFTWHFSSTAHTNYFRCYLQQRYGGMICINSSSISLTKKKAKCTLSILDVTCNSDMEEWSTLIVVVCFQLAPLSLFC